VTIRILVVDDQPVVRAGVAMMIGTQPDLEVVGEASDGLAAVSRAAELRPDVVVMDVRMPRLDGIEATRQVAALTPKPPRVVLLTTFDLDEYVFDGLLAGASGFLGLANPMGGARWTPQTCRVPHGVSPATATAGASA
jgi:DNA-binding NarL/FixJ family response regulator